MRLFRLVNRETIILTKLQCMLRETKTTTTPQLFDLFSKVPLNRSQKFKSSRFCSKSALLMRLYEQMKSHRNSMLDKAISYLREMMDCFLVFETLDYPRLLYTSRQIVKCKGILLASIQNSTQWDSLSGSLLMNKFKSSLKYDFNLSGYGDLNTIGNSYHMQETQQTIASNRMYIESSDDPEDTIENNFFNGSFKKIKFQ